MGNNWSYSQLATYLDCPLRFYWLRIEPQPESKIRDQSKAFIGILLGELLARFYLEQWWRQSEGLQQRMIAQLHTLAVTISTREEIVWANPGDLSKWIVVAAETIPKILTVLRDEQLLGPFVAVEYGMTVPVGNGDRVHGRIDILIERANGDTILLDGKGGGTIGKFASTDQLRLYALGVLADPRFRRLPTKVGFWWFRHGKIVWKQFTPATLLKFVTGVQQTIARIRAKDFEPTPGGQCRYCEFRLKCGAGQQYLWTEKFTTKWATDDNHGSVDLNNL
jgi:hypothetical protein